MINLQEILVIALIGLLVFGAYRFFSRTKGEEAQTKTTSKKTKKASKK